MNVLDEQNTLLQRHFHAEKYTKLMLTHELHITMVHIVSEPGIDSSINQVFMGVKIPARINFSLRQEIFPEKIILKFQHRIISVFPEFFFPNIHKF